jgi:Annexin
MHTLHYTTNTHYKHLLQTDEDAVCRVLGSHDKIELALIAEHYLEVYGETLSEVLKSELGGCFEKAAVAWVAKPDPLDLHALKDALAAAKAAAASRAGTL